jgi:GDP-L-fucose synthase
MSKTILVTGGSGLVGIHLKRVLPDAVYVSSKNFNLTNQTDGLNMYAKYRPDTVIHLAARVGGIFDNLNHPAEYFDENILMNTLVLRYAHQYNVCRFIGILSSCIFPDVNERYPLKEEDLHNGPPTSSNFSYGVAKRALATQIEMYNLQYKTKYSYLTPCNLYGENDKDDENKSHYVTALVKKIYEANCKKEDSITLYGDGTPLRQFMHAQDFANIINIVIEQDITESFNVAPDENRSIDEIARIAVEVTPNPSLKIKYDPTKPNGQYRKDLDITRLKKLIPNYKFISLKDGIKQFYNFYSNKRKY